MMICFIALFVLKDYFECLLDVLAAKASGKNGAVGGKEDDVYLSCHNSLVLFRVKMISEAEGGEVVHMVAPG